MPPWRPLLVITALAGACASALAAPDLPVPAGDHAVGVLRTEFVDPTRLLDAADPHSGPRRLPAVVWYPAADPAPAQGAAYLAPEAQTTTLPAMARLFRYPMPDMDALAALRVPAGDAATPATQAGGFPVIVYSHGLFLYPEQNTALAMALASRGYIVVSIAHPGDSADLRLRDGRVVPTRLAVAGDDPRFAPAFSTLMGGTSPDALRDALAVYAQALPGTRIGRSAVQWRQDTLAVAHAIAEGTAPDAAREVLATADPARFAFVGMSFGGATAAAGCRELPTCRAAVNLDGQNFDAALFDSPAGRPLLLLLSDWPRYGLLEGQPRTPDYSPNDLAYERWNAAGGTPDIVRLRLDGTRHMGFTELGTLLPGDDSAARYGDLAPGMAMQAIIETTGAFLDVHVRDADPATFDRAVGRHPALVPHVPRRLREWAQDRPASPSP